VVLLVRSRDDPMMAAGCRRVQYGADPSNRAAFVVR
jgi:hypothetical protein